MTANALASACYVLLLAAPVFWLPRPAAAANASPPSGGCAPGHARIVHASLGAATPDAARIKERVRAEVASVWLPAGVHVRWLDPILAASDATALRIIIQDHEVTTAKTQRLTPVLAWIMFAGGRPGTIIRASTRAAHLVLARSVEAQMTGTGGLHADAFLTLLARAIGWAIAHEIGHYLSGSAQHDAVGLMRPRFDAREFERPHVGSTIVSAMSIRRLQAQLETCARVAP